MSCHRIHTVLIAELEALAGVVDENVESIEYLIFHDPDQKDQHEENQAKVNKFKDTLLDLRLTLIGALEKPPSETGRKATKGKLTEEHVTEQDAIPNDERRDMLSGQDAICDDGKKDMLSGQDR
jgi:hypothetical protein